MLKILLFSLFTFTIMDSFAYTYNTLNKDKAYKLAEKYSLQGKSTVVTKKRKNISLYRLYIKDNQNIRHFRFNRTKRHILKKELYFLIYSTIKNKDFKRKYAQVRKQGIPKSAIYKVTSKKKFTIYSVEISAAADDEYDTQKNLSLAQSRIRFTPNMSNSNQFSSYGELVTGIENIGDTDNIKLTARYEQYSETSRVGEYYLSKIEIDEAYLNFTYSQSSLTLGKQLFSWGVFDEFSAIDRVNIKNSPRFIFDTGEYLRRPITAVRYEEYFNNFKVDFFIDSGSEEGKQLSPNSLWTGIDQVSGTLRGFTKEQINSDAIKDLKVYTKDRTNISQGIRLSYNSDLNAAISYLKAYTQEPILTFGRKLRSDILADSISTEGLSSGVYLEYIQEDIFAIDLTKKTGNHLFKAEYSYIPNSPLLLKSLKTIRERRQSFSLGSDMSFPVYNTKIKWQFITDHYLTEEETFRDPSSSRFMLRTESLFAKDKLSTGIDTRLYMEGSSLSFRPYIDYKLSDSDTLGISYYYFSGNSETYFGYHSEDSVAVVQYQKSF